MENSSIKGKVLSGLFWRFAERCGAQGVNFIVSIILARLLSPDDYGIVALISIFIDISYVFITSGFGTALIQKKETDDLDFCTVFYFNIGISIIFYIILFLAAPWIALLYNNSLLIPVLRVLAITVVIGGVNGIQESIVSKKMQFKKFFYATSTGTVLSAIVGIWVAYQGMGVWALVAQRLTNQVFDTIILWITTDWRPRLMFSFYRLRSLFAYGWRILVSSLIDSFYNNIYSLVIGKTYSNEQLGLYNKGQSFPRLIIGNINSSIDMVLFSALSMEQNNTKKVKNITRRSILTSTCIIFPAMAGLAGIAEPLIKLLLTDTWLACVPFVRFACFTYAFWPIHTANLQAIKAIGRSDVFLKLEIIKKILGLTILCVTIPFGITSMMVGKCISAIICMGINAWPNKKYLDYGIREQVRDIIPAGCASVLMFIAICFIGKLKANDILGMSVQILGGGVIYLMLAKVFKLEALNYVKNTFKQLICYAKR